MISTVRLSTAAVAAADHLAALQVKEIIYPGGAEIDIRAIRVGDPSLSVLEIWGAEYQENDCLLIRPESRRTLQGVCDRERCPMQVREPALLMCSTCLLARKHVAGWLVVRR